MPRGPDYIHELTAREVIIVLLHLLGASAILIAFVTFFVFGAPLPFVR